MAANPPKSKPIRLPNGTLSMPDTLTNPLTGTEALQGEEPEYEVEKIVGKSIWSGNGRGPNGGRRTKYLIKWVGYDEPQWEFAESGPSCVRPSKAHTLGHKKKFFSFDGGSEVMSRVRRGVLSLRVVRQMLS